MSMLEIQVEAVAGVEKCVVVHLTGALDQPTMDTFLNGLKSVRSNGNIRCILDMQGVTYANSTALGALVSQADTFRGAGGDLAILRPQPKVNLVIEMLGLNAMFPIFATLDEARAHLAEGSAAPPKARPREAPEPAQPHAASFPLRAECIGCGVVLEFAQASRFRCPHCGAVYTVDEGGRIAGAKPRASQAIELTLPCHPQAMAAFRQFVGALPSWAGYSDEDRAQLERAVGEVCDTLHQRAYDGDDEATLHLLVVYRDGELVLRVADHGKPLELSDFPIASAYMSDFEVKPHPVHGNLLKMAKRAV